MAAVVVMGTAADAAIVPTVGLGVAGDDAVIGGQTVTNTGPTTMSRSLDVFPGTTDPFFTGPPQGQIKATIVGVGVTEPNAMDAPEGPLGNPVWQQAYWFRGSAIPGARSTALIAGHIDGPRGSAALFGRLGELKPGDPIVVHDTRNGLNVVFSVTSAQSFSLDQTLDHAVLNQIYGVGPVAGTVPQRSVDGLSHLTLITCAGTFTNGTHDHRLAVFATRVT